MASFELARENAHPRAVELLSEDFWWDCLEETAPFGNDTGSDTIDEYWRWRRFHESYASIDFLPKLLKGWEVDDSHRNLIEEEAVHAALEKDEFSVTTYDDAVIALFFSGLILFGRIDSHLVPLAKMAIARQKLDVCRRLYADDVQEKRLSRLERMGEVLLDLE